jgi:hypothetical protein
MTPDHPGFAAAVRVATRALAERIAAITREGRTSPCTRAVTDAAPITVQPIRLLPVRTRQPLSGP